MHVQFNYKCSSLSEKKTLYKVNIFFEYWKKNCVVKQNVAEQVTN